MAMPFFPEGGLMQMYGLVTYKTRCSPIRVVFVGIKLSDF